MITSPTFIFYLSDTMQSYPLHTHNVVLFLVSSWKQTFGVRRVASVADRACENIDLPFSSLWVQNSILITSIIGNCYDDSLYLGIIKLFSSATMITCTWGLSSSFLAPLPGSNSMGLIFSCVLVCFLHQIDIVFPFCLCLVVGETYKTI